jgi:CHAD domain-containing protein
MIGPPAETVAARLASDRDRLLARFDQAARRTRRRADSGAIHDVRVAARRLEAELDVWRSSLPGRRRRRARRALRDLRRALGPAREAQIGLDLLHERLQRLPPEARVAAALVQERLQRRLEALERRATGRCGPRDAGRVRRRLERAWPHPSAALGAESLRLQDARSRVGARRTRALAALGQATIRSTDEALHDARIALKRWRYALERLAAVDPATDTSEREWLATVQDALGRIQDLAVLRAHSARLKRLPEVSGTPGGMEGLRGLLRALEEERTAHVSAFCRLAAWNDTESGRVLAFPPGSGRREGEA